MLLPGLFCAPVFCSVVLFSNWNTRASFTPCVSACLLSYVDRCNDVEEYKRWPTVTPLQPKCVRNSWLMVPEQSHRPREVWGGTSTFARKENTILKP
jgi:hypothetical protein